MIQKLTLVMLIYVYICALFITDSTNSDSYKTRTNLSHTIPRLLMAWHRKEPGHQEQWYWQKLLVCDLNRTPNCYGKTWRLLCPFFRNLHLRENLARDCFTSTASAVTNSVQNISLPVYVIVTNTRLQPLTTTFYNSMLVSFSLLKI